MSRALANVTRTARRRTVAQDAYRAAIIAAASEHGTSAIARAAGVTPQAVDQLLRRARAATPEGGDNA